MMGFEDQEPLRLGRQAQIMEVAGLILYALFYIILIIVLLNALIAIMSEVYNSVEVRKLARDYCFDEHLRFKSSIGYCH